MPCVAFWQAGWHPDTCRTDTAHVAPVWRECEKAPVEGVPVGSKVVLVKGVMLLWQHNSEKHRPAKPFGDYEVT